MAVVSATLRLRSGRGYEVHDVTGHVRAAVQESDLQSGIVTVFVPGSTGGLTTVEYEPGLVKDLEEFFDRAIPEGPPYHHDQRWHDGNGHAHVRASLIGPSITVPFEDGDLELGTWQQVIFLDFDPPARDRTLKLKIIGE
jgi:secondary thiamine-phosphate synthase enzyme